MTTRNIIYIIRNTQADLIDNSVEHALELIESALSVNKAMRIEMLFHHIWFHYIEWLRELVKKTFRIWYWWLKWYWSDTCYLETNYSELLLIIEYIKRKKIRDVKKMRKWNNDYLIDATVEYKKFDWYVTSNKVASERTSSTNHDMKFIFLLNKRPIHYKEMKELLSVYFGRDLNMLSVEKLLNKNDDIENMWEWFYYLKSMIW